MKKILLLSIVFVCSLQAFAKVPRNAYVTVGYVMSEVKKQGEYSGLNSRYGMSISVGYTFLLNKKPLWNNVYVGVDWTFLHGDFRQYRFKMADYIPKSRLGEYNQKDINENNEIDHTTIGMQIGPSLTMMAAKDLQLSAYFRYAPSLDFIETSVDPYNPPTDARLGSYQESVDYSYAGYYTVGVSASYKIFMAGVEYTTGSMQHRVHTSNGMQEVKFDNKGVWLNIGVRLGKGGIGKKKNYTYDDALTNIF